MKYILILFLALTSISCNNKKGKKEIPNEFIAKVIGVKDGDTIEVLYENNPIVIRFEHIDCPEKKQPFGKKAKQFVSDNIFGKNVHIISKGKTDRWKRLIAVVELENGENLNKMLVQNGLAMHFKKYSKDNSYDIIERGAENNKIGMWSQKTVIEPWNYRKSKKKK
ncbi:MAG: thermonuclease family protein [Urechidicola sp.]|nr:thermonuclease family protein [Urechidicola sp.]